MYKEVKGHKDLARNSNGAIVNINSDAYKAAVERKKRIKNKKEEYERIASDINIIKQELAELKEIIKDITNDGR